MASASALITNHYHYHVAKAKAKGEGPVHMYANANAFLYTHAPRPVRVRVRFLFLVSVVCAYNSSMCLQSAMGGGCSCSPVRCASLSSVCGLCLCLCLWLLANDGVLFFCLLSLSLVGFTSLLDHPRDQGGQ
jgi:hypothetical protein